MYYPIYDYYWGLYMLGLIFMPRLTFLFLLSNLFDMPKIMSFSMAITFLIIAAIGDLYSNSQIFRER